METEALDLTENSTQLQDIIQERDSLKVDIDRLTAELNNVRQPWVAYDPHLMPTLEMMRGEGIHVLEEWFRWAEEWHMLLRVYGRLSQQSAILEIGCGNGRTAFPLRYVLSPDGTYDGFDVTEEKIKFLDQTFHQTYPNFRFTYSDIHNTNYNPDGKIASDRFLFPYQDGIFDIVYAASFFTHMLPKPTENYFQQASRVLKPGGRCLFSFFLLENYIPNQPRPGGFIRPSFNFDHTFEDYGDDFALGVPENPEEMTAYSMNLIEQFVKNAGLKLVQSPLPGYWSGSHKSSISTQDLIVLEKPNDPAGQ